MSDDNNTKLIPLTQGKFAIVDADDYGWLSQYNWCLVVKGKYCCRRHGKHIIYMHREIMGIPKGLQIDHINGDGLDNRRCNLRVCTHQQNTLNSTVREKTSKYKGVYWSKQKKRWISCIVFKGKKTYIGTFLREVDAAEAYKVKAVELFGEFASFRRRRVDVDYQIHDRNNIYKPKKRINNTTGCACVTFHKKAKRYIPRITIEGKRIHLGSFKTLKEAEEVYLSKLAELSNCKS